MFRSLHSDSISLYLIDEGNFRDVQSMFQGFQDSDTMLKEINEHYIPEYEKGRRTKYGFYALLGNELAGLSLLGISDWKQLKGYTGADTLMHMRGKGIAPQSKPHLFYLAFEILNLHRVETGCLVSNLASKRSIEKTPGFRFEGTMRESGLTEQGTFEDEYLYAILKKDWLKLYDKTQIYIR
jgi:ribosomal-protein-serine acetyltransferase